MSNSKTVYVVTWLDYEYAHYEGDIPEVRCKAFSSFRAADNFRGIAGSQEAVHMLEIEDEEVR